MKIDISFNDLSFRDHNRVGGLDSLLTPATHNGNGHLNINISINDIQDDGFNNGGNDIDATPSPLAQLGLDNGHLKVNPLQTLVQVLERLIQLLTGNKNSKTGDDGGDGAGSGGGNVGSAADASAASGAYGSGVDEIGGDDTGNDYDNGEDNRYGDSQENGSNAWQPQPARGNTQPTQSTQADGSKPAGATGSSDKPAETGTNGQGTSTAREVPSTRPANNGAGDPNSNIGKVISTAHVNQSHTSSYGPELAQNKQAINNALDGMVPPVSKEERAAAIGAAMIETNTMSSGDRTKDN